MMPTLHTVPVITSAITITTRRVISWMSAVLLCVLASQLCIADTLRINTLRPAGCHRLELRRAVAVSLSQMERNMLTWYFAWEVVNLFLGAVLSASVLRWEEGGGRRRVMGWEVIGMCGDCGPERGRRKGHIHPCVGVYVHVGGQLAETQLLYCDGLRCDVWCDAMCWCCDALFLEGRSHAACASMGFHQCFLPLRSG
jgi:hypothetical protein